MESSIRSSIDTALEEAAVSRDSLESLAANLVWRIGRVSDDGPVTIRVGLASSSGLFVDLPRLRSASDSEIEAAVRDGDLRVEWVGVRPR